MKKTLLTLALFVQFSCQKELEPEPKESDGVTHPVGYGHCTAPTFQNDGRILRNPTSPTAEDGLIDLIPLSGKPPFRYSIDGGTTWQTGFDYGYSYTGLKAGKYYLTIKDNSGCQSLVIEHQLK